MNKSMLFFVLLLGFSSAHASYQDVLNTSTGPNYADDILLALDRGDLSKARYYTSKGVSRGSNVYELLLQQQEVIVGHNTMLNYCRTALNGAIRIRNYLYSIRSISSSARRKVLNWFGDNLLYSNSCLVLVGASAGVESTL